MAHQAKCIALMELKRMYNLCTSTLMIFDGQTLNNYIRFPGWHRIYLYEFELALQAADRANGNNGRIALPYWDWIGKANDGLPSVIRNRLATWPDDLFPNDFRPSRPLQRNSDALIRSRMNGWDVLQDVNDSLVTIDHHIHVPTMEEPHGEMHAAVGGAMGFVPTYVYIIYM